MPRSSLLGLLCGLSFLAGCGDRAPAPRTAPASASMPVRFTEVAAAAGIDFRHERGARGDYYYPETYGSGAGLFDVDGDGWLDVYLVNGGFLGADGNPPAPAPVANRLYRNRGGVAGAADTPARGLTFDDVTQAWGAGDAGYGMGCAAGDADNDGDTDLYVANFGANVFFRNAGDRFADITAITGTGDRRWSTSTGFTDIDLDGDLDLYVVNYVDYALETNPVCRKGSLRAYCDPDVFDPIGDGLYRNDGDGARPAFTDVTAAAGVGLVGRGLGVAFQDYDLDGDTDIYVTNDGEANFLYDNRGGYFVDVGLQAGVRFNMNGQAEAGMGVDFGDVDGDRWPDIVVGNFAYETTTLYRNGGDGHFEDATGRAGIAAASHGPLTFGVRLVDLDNDGDLDLLTTNGHVLDNVERVDPGQSYRQPPQVWANAGGRFVDVSGSLGPDFGAAIVARGTATGDVDNDGDVDVLINTSGGPARLLRNDGGNASHWLELHLVGAGARDALGARVTVTAAGRTQTQQRQSGGSYLATHDPRLHFGLGAATRAEVRIRWPDGRAQVVGQVAADQILRVVQPAP